MGIASGFKLFSRKLRADEAANLGFDLLQQQKRLSKLRELHGQVAGGDHAANLARLADQDASMLDNQRDRIKHRSFGAYLPVFLGKIARHPASLSQRQSAAE